MARAESSGALAPGTGEVAIDRRQAAPSVPPDAGAGAGGRAVPGIGRVPGAARLLGATSFAHFINDGVVFFVPVVAALLAQGHHTSTAMVTAMLVVFYATSAAAGIAVGLLADRLGRRTMLIGVGIATLGASLFGFYAALSVQGVGSDVLAVVSGLVAGLGSSFYHPLGGSVLQLGFPDGARGKALGINGAFGSLGRALYPALFFVVAALGISKATTSALFGGLSILAAVLVVIGLSTRDSERALWVHSVPRTSHRPKDAPRPVVRSLLGRSVVSLMAISFLRSLGFIGVVSFIPIYLSAERHVGVATALGFTVTVMYAGGIIGQPLFGLLADRFDKRFVLALDSLGSAGGIYLFLSTSGDGPSALFALFVFGMFTFSGFPLLLSLVADYVPREASTTGNALVWGVGSTGGQALGPLVTSLVMAGSDAHLGFAFALLGGLVAATVLATPLLGKVTRSTHMALFG
jgi:FSR family fosmidomycin resistance protein-like MFS transporter